MNIYEKPSIIFSTPWKRLHDGWAIASRAYARAMHSAGVHINMNDTIIQDSIVLDNEVHAEMKDILDSPFSPAIDYHLWSGMLMGYDRMARVIQSMQNQQTPVGYYCVFERRTLEEELVSALKDTSIWVQSMTNLKVLKSYGFKDISYIPYPWFEDDPLRKIEPTTSSRNFYWIGRFEPRKAPDMLIRAFMRAFKPGEARLWMKISPYVGPDYHQSAESVILDELTWRDNSWNVHNWSDNIRLDYSRLTRNEMIQLHADNDIYVSPSRGEGLELGAWEAKQASRRIIATESGGPENYMSNEDILIPSSRGLLSAHSCYDELWGKNGTYIDYKIEDLIIALQTARASSQGVRYWNDSTYHRSDNVGLMLKNWLLERIPT